jgi:hypothetical protein
VCLLIFIGVEIRMGVGSTAIHDMKWFKLWFIELLPLIICRLMCLHHIYYINLLASHIQYIQQELKELVKFAEYSIYVKFDRSVISGRLEVFKDLYGLLFQLTENVNDLFCWSQGFNFIRMFLESTCDLHWFYKDFAYYFPFLVFNFITMTVCLLLLLRAANSCVQKAKSLAPLLFQIKYIDGEATLRRMVGTPEIDELVIYDFGFQIYQFSSQLIHEPIRFGGHDVFTINYGLLRTVRFEFFLK